MPKKETLLDLLVVAEDLDRRLAPRCGEALIRNLCTIRIGRPVDEAVADEWAEVYLEPGASAHTAFVKGGYTDEAPVFKEMVFRFGTKPVDMPFGKEGQQVNFYIEFRGCRFDDMLGSFKVRFKDIMYVKPQIFTRPHEPLAPHREVPEDEQPQDKRKKKRDAGGLAGTRVEEF